MAGLEFNVAIRTFEFHNNRVWLGVGGGVVADSEIENEWLECLIKARPLIKAVGSTIDEHAGKVTPHPRALAVSLRPRPAVGVFTSTLVLNGNTLDLPGHIARLDNSSRNLFSRPLPESVENQIRECLDWTPTGRLRIEVKPVGGPLRTKVKVLRLDEAPDSIGLRTVTVSNGLGEHKWADRRLLAVLAEQTGLRDTEQLLLQDSYGQVLETDRANIFAVIDGVLRTPPADGRILPGITRALLLTMASDRAFDVQVAPIEYRALLSSSEVFVTNAVRGIVPVHIIDGAQVGWGACPVVSQVQECITKLWSTNASKTRIN
jgi:para-aminobenzoate synthetase / 4-amino-4-deoxychorismate lyase